MRHVVGLVLVLALLPAAAPASTSIKPTLSDLVESAELVAIGRVVPREGDPTTFGFVRHAFEVERVIKGELPDRPPLLKGAEQRTYDPETGERAGGGWRSHVIAWREGEVLLAFLRRVDGDGVWSAHYTGVRRLLPGDHALYASKIRELLDVLGRSDDERRVAAKREWALSLLDYSATLRDATYELFVGDGILGRPPRLGEFSDADRLRILHALVRHGDATGWDHGFEVRALIPLVGNLRSEQLDQALAVYVPKEHHLSISQRVRYAKLLAERLDDDGLQELARSFEELADSPRAASDALAERSAWKEEVNARAWAFRREAFDSIRRFHW